MIAGTFSAEVKMKSLGKIRGLSQSAMIALPQPGKRLFRREASVFFDARWIAARWLRVSFVLAALLPARAASPWRIWTKADGLRESVAFGLTSDSAGRIFIKGGDIPSINVLDGYQITINDTSGHVVGDLFLKEVSARLLRSTRKQDTLARLGGDEFAIVMPRLMDRNEAESMAQRLLDVLRQPYQIESYELTGSASIGVSLFPEHGQDTATLQRLADVAMYQCKAQNKDEYAVFDSEVNRLDFQSAQIAGLIREALENDYFRLHYQPLKATDGSLVGFEALVRLDHPHFGLIPPDDFISTAEHTGLIVRVGNWVLREACLQMVRWHAAGNQRLRINVNVSSVQLAKSNYVDVVKSILNETGLKPRALTLEITETGALRGLRGSLGQIEELRAMGVTIALDDFGTGYSTPDSFYSLPVDYIKIDRSFAARLTEKAEFSLDVIEAITKLAHKFGFEIVAEGIEFPEQLAAMKSIGCDVLQGYLLGRPMTSQDTDELLNSTERRARQLRMLEERLEASRRIAALAP